MTRSRESSTVAVADEARKLAQEIQKELPEGTLLEVTQDGGEEAQNSLNNGCTRWCSVPASRCWWSMSSSTAGARPLITALSLPTSVLAAFHRGVADGLFASTS